VKKLGRDSDGNSDDCCCCAGGGTGR
jgi:hypothetical protein